MFQGKKGFIRTTNAPTDFPVDGLRPWAARPIPNYLATGTVSEEIEKRYTWKGCRLGCKTEIEYSKSNRAKGKDAQVERYVGPYLRQVCDRCHCRCTSCFSTHLYWDFPRRTRSFTWEWTTPSSAVGRIQPLEWVLWQRNIWRTVPACEMTD